MTKRSPDRTGWSLTDHVCRACLGGRILKREVCSSVEPAFEFICSNCETRSTTTGGVTVQSICVCGSRFNDVPRGPGKRKGQNMGLVCMPNPNRGPSSPSVIVAGEAQ